MDCITYEDKNDEQLIEMLHNGHSEIMDFMLEKYKNLVRKKANAMFLLGGDTDDLIQEGMIGLFKAIRDFDGEKGGSFLPFANLCINRQIYSAVEAASRKKHGPLNTYVSLSTENENGNNHMLEQFAENRDENPEYLMLHQEYMTQFLEDVSAVLSPMEKQVLHAFLEGLSYSQIAERLGRTEKSVDNAFQRIKNKALKLENKKKG